MPASKKSTHFSRRTAMAKAKAAWQHGKRRSRAKRQTKYWSADVTQHSNAMDLEQSVFNKPKPSDVARSLKRSAERSHRRKSSPYRSAMSMLTFYINRAGKNLPKRRLNILEHAKGELRRLFGRE